MTVIGDGTTEVVTLAGEKLKNMEELTRLGSELPLPKAIKETCSLLGNKVFAWVPVLTLKEKYFKVMF